MTVMLKTELLRLDGGTQPRAEVDGPTVAEYAEDMAAGAKFPPVTVFYDGLDYWLADGFHRYRATLTLGRNAIEAEVHQGTQRDAIIFSCGANIAHGMRRTNDDKRRAVSRMLSDPEWSQWSDTRIATVCGVDKSLVARLRPDPPAESTGQPRTYINRYGGTSVMHTANIAQANRARVTEPTAASRPAGYREPKFQPVDLGIETTLRSVIAAMAALPTAERVAAAVPHADRTAADRIAMWWTDFAEALGDRA